VPQLRERQRGQRVTAGPGAAQHQATYPWPTIHRIQTQNTDTQLFIKCSVSTMKRHGGAAAAQPSSSGPADFHPNKAFARAV
jgi:hypothetical protein